MISNQKRFNLEEIAERNKEDHKNASTLLDSDNDGIPDDWEINGYTVENGVIVAWEEEKHVDKGFTKYCSDPYNSHTTGDPYSDREKVLGQVDGLNGPVNPLVALYPQIKVEMEKLLVSKNITMAVDKQNSASQEKNNTVTLSINNSHTDAVTIGVSSIIGAEVGTFNVGVSTSVSNNLSSESSNIVSIDKGKSTMISEALARSITESLSLNQSEVAFLNGNIRYNNIGNIPIYNLKPTINFTLGEGNDAETIVTVAANEKMCARVVLPGEKYPIKTQNGIAWNTSDDFNTQPIKLNYQQIKELIAWKPLQIQITQSMGEYKKYDFNGDSYIASDFKWEYVLPDIYQKTALITIALANGEIYERRVAALSWKKIREFLQPAEEASDEPLYDEDITDDEDTSDPDLIINPDPGDNIDPNLDRPIKKLRLPQLTIKAAIELAFPEANFVENVLSFKDVTLDSTKLHIVMDKTTKKIIADQTEGEEKNIFDLTLTKEMKLFFLEDEHLAITDWGAFTLEDYAIYKKINEKITYFNGDDYSRYFDLKRQIYFEANLAPKCEILTNSIKKYLLSLEIPLRIINQLQFIWASGAEDESEEESEQITKGLCLDHWSISHPRAWTLRLTIKYGEANIIDNFLIYFKNIIFKEAKDIDIVLKETLKNFDKTVMGEDDNPPEIFDFKNSFTFENNLGPNARNLKEILKAYLLCQKLFPSIIIEGIDFEFVDPQKEDADDIAQVAASNFNFEDESTWMISLKVKYYNDWESEVIRFNFTNVRAKTLFNGPFVEGFENFFATLFKTNLTPVERLEQIGRRIWNA